MEGKVIPISLGSFSAAPEDVAPVAIAVVIGVLMLFGIRRELATAAIMLGIIGAMLVR